MLRELEAACGGRDDAFWIVHRGRLVFLAFAGRTAAVDRLVAPDVARHMTRSARSYWRGIAAARAGDAAAAEGAYNSALAGSRGRARELVTRAIDELPTVVPQPASELVRVTADAAEAAPLARPQPVARRRRMTTGILIALNVAVTATIAITLGAPSDPAIIVRAGGALRGAIDHGEWWRLISTTTLHIGVVHLVLNLLALLALGRWTESIFGSRPVAAIYALSGLAGSAASYLFGAATLSAGASGAIFGLLGAFMVELFLHRRAYQRVWQSGMMGALLIAFAAQMALGYSLPQDQLAHIGGLVAGALAGLAFSPHRKAKRAVAIASTAITAAAIAAAVVAAVMVVRTSFGDTLARSPRTTRVTDGIAITVPAEWQADPSGAYLDPDLFIGVRVARPPAGTDWIGGEADRAHDDHGFDHSMPATDRVLRLPPGWTGSELIAYPPADELVDQRYRVVAAVRGDGIAASIYVPDALAADAGPQLTAMLASIVDRDAHP
jgi:membrane associated rhomboid family serine protease